MKYLPHDNQVGWILSLVRITGVIIPWAAPLVQLQAEIDSKALQKRIANLEDPISSLHHDVPKVSREIYRKMQQVNSIKLDFDDGFYKKFSRPLAALKSQGYIKAGHAFGKNYAAGIRLVSPAYIMYLCAMEEDGKKMQSLVQTVSDCEIGECLDGNKLEVDLPLPVVRAVFDIFESKGFGICSNEKGANTYIGKA